MYLQIWRTGTFQHVSHVLLYCWTNVGCQQILANLQFVLKEERKRHSCPT